MAINWNCACGWHGPISELKPSPSGSLVCPNCGASGGLEGVSPEPAAQQPSDLVKRARSVETGREGHLPPKQLVKELADRIEALEAAQPSEREVALVKALERALAAHHAEIFGPVTHVIVDAPEATAQPSREAALVKALDKHAPAIPHHSKCHCMWCDFNRACFEAYDTPAKPDAGREEAT